MAPEALAQVLRPIQNMFNIEDHPNLLVGLGVPDDAAVYRLNDEQALIFTTDFFTPIVDDPYQYGAIAATNALSDVYAMGGTPVLALNIAALPPNLPVEMSQQIILGMSEKMKETGGVIAGGHTITDDEPKVGLAVVGLTHPARLLTKAGAKPGDVLVLTKPLGTGCITTAAKNDKADKTHVDAAVEWMMKLNRPAAEAAQAAKATAATDITGFGFLGHASELAISSGVTLHFEVDRFGFLPGASGYADGMIFPGGSFNNKLAYEKGVRFADGISEEVQMLLFDAQTSGGLLIALPAENLEIFTREMAAREAPFWQTGRVEEKQVTNIIVSP